MNSGSCLHAGAKRPGDVDCEEFSFAPPRILSTLENPGRRAGRFLRSLHPSSACPGVEATCKSNDPFSMRTCTKDQVRKSSRFPQCGLGATHTGTRFDARPGIGLNPMQELTTETASPADWDGPWKDAITALLRHFLAMFYPAVHDEIDWSRGFEALDKELQKIAPASETGRRTVDLLFKVWLLTGEERWVLLHVEVQAQRDPGLPERVFVYNYRIKDYYGVPSASFVILADDERTWRPGPYRYNLWNCGGEFHYPTVKLLDFANQADELEKNANPFAVVVLAHLKARETADDRSRRRVWKVRLLKGLYNRGWDARTFAN